MVINILCSQLSQRNEMNKTGFHDSALCCVGAVKNSLHIHSLPWGARCDNIKQCFAKYHCFPAAHYRGIWLLLSLPWLRFSSNLGDFAVNNGGKDGVSLHTNAQIVSSGTV